MPERLLQRLESFLWAALVLLLPVTSLPLISRLTGGTMVAPASAIPLVLLMIVFLIPFFIRGGGLPRLNLPLLYFVCAALLASALSFFFFFPLFRDASRLRSVTSAVATLLLGVSFFLLAVTWVDSKVKMRHLYLWLNISGVVLILWSLAQTIFWSLNQDYPDWMWRIQGILSVSGNLYDRRTTGLAFEPSWLGHQLVMIFLPYWLAATLTKTSAVSFRLKFFTLENVLLLGGISVLWLSLSRSALISFALSAALAVMMLAGAGVRWLRLNARRQSRLPPRIIAVLFWATILLVVALFALGAVYFLTRVDPRMSDLFSLLLSGTSPLELAEKLIFGERVAFWLTGINIFSQYPFLGVGLNNSGYFIPENLPLAGWTLVESHKMYYSTALPNTLSLWIRLLAETGVLGFSLFISWLVLIWKTARQLTRARDKYLRTAALVAQFTLAAMLMEGMSVDTFAFPYFWLSFGWMMAAYRIYRNEKPIPSPP